MVVKTNDPNNPELPKPDLSADRPLYSGGVPMPGEAGVGPGPHPSNDPEPVGPAGGK